MKNKHKCIYCSAKREDIAWLSQPELSSSCINFNLNGTLPIGDNKRHEGISAKIKDYGHLIGIDENDSGYMKYIQENPGSLEIRSESEFFFNMSSMSCRKAGKYAIFTSLIINSKLIMLSKERKTL